MTFLPPHLPGASAAPSGSRPPPIPSTAKVLSLDEIETEWNTAITNRNKRQKDFDSAREAFTKLQNSAEKTKSARSKNTVWEENGDMKTTWYAAPSYMMPYMPSTLEPSRIYRDLSHKLRTNICETDHHEISELWREFGEALPNDCADFRRAVQLMRNDAEELVRKPQYTRLKCAVHFSQLLSETDQRRVDQKIDDNKRHGSMLEHAVKSTRQAMNREHKAQASGDDAYLLAGQWSVKHRAAMFHKALNPAPSGAKKRGGSSTRGGRQHNRWNSDGRGSNQAGHRGRGRSQSRGAAKRPRSESNKRKTSTSGQKQPPAGLEKDQKSQVKKRSNAQVWDLAEKDLKAVQAAKVAETEG